MTKPKKQRLTNAIRALWPFNHQSMHEARYTNDAAGIGLLVEDVVKYGRPKRIELYHSDPLVPPQVEELA